METTIGDMIGQEILVKEPDVTMEEDGLEVYFVHSNYKVEIIEHCDSDIECMELICIEVQESGTIVLKMAGNWCRDLESLEDGVDVRVYKLVDV